MSMASACIIPATTGDSTMVDAATTSRSILVKSRITIARFIDPVE